MKFRNRLAKVLIIMMLISLLPNTNLIAYAATPLNETFEHPLGFGNFSYGTIIGDWTFGLIKADGSDETSYNMDSSSSPYIGIVDNSGGLTYKLMENGNKCLEFIGTSPGHKAGKISSTSGDEFKLTSFNIEDGGVAFSYNYTIKGYKNGTFIEGATFSFDAQFDQTNTVNPYIENNAFGDIDAFTIEFTNGEECIWFCMDNITVEEPVSSTPSNSTISPATGSFDKKTSSQANVTTTVTLNGNTLSSITNGGTPLVLNTNYTVSGDTVTIKKEYLAALAVGTTNLTFNFSVGNTQTLAIAVSDTTAPVVSEVIVPANGTYTAGQNLDFTVSFDKAVTVTGTPQISLVIGTTTRNANYISGNGTSSLVFTHTILNEDNDNDGITIGTLVLNGGTIKDSAQNNAVLTLIGVGATTGVKVDATSPSLTAGAVYRTSDTLGTVKFTSDEAGQYYYGVVVDGAAEPIIITSGVGTACTTSETIINLIGLTSGAKDIYIKVKDAAGNVSNAVKIDIADYIAPPITYTITYMAGANGTITGATPQTVNQGADGTTVTAVADAGYHFVKWSDDVTTASRTDSNVSGNVNVTATFAIDQYTLTYTAGTNGSIAGTTVQTVNHGADGTTVTAVPAVGYHFVSWSDGVTTASRTDSNVSGNVNVTATFAIDQYTLTYTAGTNGSITGTKIQTVNHGLNGTEVEAVPNAGYHFVKWSDNVTTAKRIDSNVLGNISVTATFAINEYTLRYSAEANGSITGTTVQTVNHGLNGTEVEAVPNAGYHFVSWSDNVTTAKRTEIGVTGNITVTASFAINEYTLSYSAGANGSVTGTKIQTVNHGLNGTEVEAVPNAGYHFVKWSDNVTTAKRTDSNVLGNMSVTATFAINEYTLSYSAGANGSITGTTVQTVNHGGSGTEVTAVPAVGYHFVSWSDGVTTASRTDSNVSGSVNVTATFAIDQYTLTYTAGANGSVTGTKIQTVNHGLNGTEVEAVPNAGYHFVKWSDNVTTAKRTDSNVLGNISVTATFAINEYTLSYSAGANGSITGITPQTVNHGTNGTEVTAVPAAGYHFVSWSDGKLTASRTDSNVSGNVNVTATFAINQYTLSYSAGANGSITGTTPQTVNHGADGTEVTAVPAAGYHFVSWSDGKLTASRTDSNVSGSVNVTATFAINQYTLTYGAGANGSITGTTPQTVNHGADGTEVTAVPAAGYHFVSWSDGVTTASRTDSNVSGNVNVTATFAINQYTLTYGAGANGNITGTTPQTVNHGADGTEVTAVPAAGYHFVSWSDGKLTASRTDSNVSGNVNVTATFAINQYTLTYGAGANGSITGTTPQTVNHGADGTEVTAVPAAGYHFVSWSDGKLTASRTDSNVSGNVNVTATFAIDQYTLTYVAGVNGSITGTTVQTVNHGLNGTEVKAVPNAGYHFVKWSDNVTTAKRTETGVIGNITVTATFAIDQYTLTYIAGANGSITGTKIQTVNHGANGTEVTATPAAGYHFVKWSDNVTTAKRTETGVIGNITVTATFAINQYTLTYVAGANGSITGTIPQTVNHGANGTEVTAVPAAGYHFVKWSDDVTTASRTDSNVSGNVNVTATFAINQYTLTYGAGANGSITGTTPQTVNHGADGTEVTAVPAAGYHFVSWSDGKLTASRTDSNVSGNVNVTATFAINQYTLTYNAGANGSITGTKIQTVNHGANGTEVTAVPAAGYHFVSWSDGKLTASRTDSNISGNVNVTATFAINEYTLTYVSGANGSITGTTLQTVNHGTNGTEVTAVPNAGYHFVKWSDDVTTASRTDSNVSGNINVTASFAINKYTVTFKDHDGTVIGSPQSIEYGSGAISPSNPTRTGYTFANWNKDFSNISEDLVVTAKYTINSYAVTFNVDGGSAVADATISYNGKATKPTVDPTKTGYTFGGWYADSNCTTAFDFATKLITEATTVYAKWSSTACNITIWTVPEAPTVTGLAVAKAVTNGTTSIIVAVTASADATWKLYSDAACTTEITNKTMTLSVGANTAYVKVTAQDTTTSKVYTLTVTRAAAEYNGGGYTPPTPSVETEVITVDVTNGDAGNAISKTTIDRTTESNGTITDRVEYKKESAQQTVDQLKKSGGDTARIVIPDKKDKVSEVKVTIPKVTLSIIAQNNVNLEIDTENARIILPNESIQNLEENLFFRLLPIKGDEKQKEIKERAKKEEVIKQVAGDRDISLIGRPMTIETNMSQREVDIILPLKDIAIPKDPKERAAFLKRLGVFIEHSDGEKVLARAELVEFKDGILGLKFRINKFSTFTIIEFPENVPSFDGETLIIEQKINLNQGWTIEFSNDADQGTVTQSSIYITDSKGKIHSTELTASENVVNVKLMENYRANETYYLCITKTIKSRTGKVLIKSVRYKFNTSQLSK